MVDFKKDEIDNESISDGEDATDRRGLLQTESDTASHTLPRRLHSPRWLWYGAAIGVPALLCITNLLTYFVTISAASRWRPQASVAEPPNLTPMLRDLNLKTMHAKFDSTFFSQGSQYREPPSPRTDAAWDRAGANFGFLLIPAEQEKVSDLTPDHIHLLGTADQSFLTGIPADVEVFHQLHCLNLLRKATFYNHNYYRQLGTGEFQHPDRDLAIHVDHCIDNLRQRIMCTSDVGLVPFYWVGDDGQTDPEFSRTHTCRDFETLHDWMMEHMVVLDPNSTLRPRPGDYRVQHFH